MYRFDIQHIHLNVLLVLFIKGIYLLIDQSVEESKVPSLAVSSLENSWTDGNFTLRNQSITV